MDSAIHDGAEYMSVHTVAGLIKFFSPVSRAGLSTCPGRDLPGQLDGLLRTSLPGQTVTGQDPASVDRLDLFQRGQGPVVILVHEPRGQLRPGQVERPARLPGETNLINPATAWTDMHSAPS